jgi:predicted RND superfamily exporter protein
MVERYARWLLKYRGWVVAAFLAAALVAASGGRFLGFSDNYRVFFGKENPDLARLDAVQNMYVKDDNLLFVLAPRNGAVFTRETLSAVEWLTAEAWKLPYSTRVDSVTNFQHTAARGDDLEIRNLVEDAGALSDAALDAARNVALAEPLMVNRILSPRGHVTGVNVTTTFPQTSLREVPEVAAAARALAERLRERAPGLDVYLTGTVMFNNAYAEYGEKDMKTLVPLMFGVILLITFLILRSVTGTAVTLLAVALSIATTLGLAGWLGLTLTPVSVAAPTIILTVAVADAIHLLLGVLHGMSHGQGKRAAIVDALRLNFRGLVLTAANTVVGFLTLNASDSPPYRDLGNMVAMGVAVAFVLTLSFLPALLSFLPLRVRPGAMVGDVAMDRLAEWVIRRRKPLLSAVVAGSLVLAAFSMRNEVYDDFNRYFDHRTDIRRHNDFAAENLTGSWIGDYSIAAAGPGGITDPAYLHTLDRFVQWYRAQPGIAHVYSITDIVKQLNKSMHGDDPAFYRIPDDPELVAQYLLLYEMSVPFGLDLNDRLNVDRSATRVTVTWRLPTSKEYQATEEAAQDWLRRNAPEHMFSRATGPGPIFSTLGKRNLQSMLQGDLLGIFAIAVVMVLALKSVRFGLMTLIPNLLPTGVAFGLWGLLVGRLGMDAAPVTGMTLGLLIDDTTHTMIKYLHARREMGLSPGDAVRYTFATVGKATMAISLTLLAGFGVLSLSAFRFNSTMGLLSAVIIAAGGLVEFLLMPPMLLKLEEKEHEESLLLAGPEPAPGALTA